MSIRCAGDFLRVSAAYELVALTLPELVRLAGLALIADGPDWPQECARAARDNAAAVLRLLDRALLAHGRDAGYEIDAWRQRATIEAFTIAAVAAAMETDEQPHTTMVQGVAEAVGTVIIALHRDRIGVPEGLADAIGTLLVIYAANTADPPG